MEEASPFPVTHANFEIGNDEERRRVEPATPTPPVGFLGTTASITIKSRSHIRNEYTLARGRLDGNHQSQQPGGGMNRHEVRGTVESSSFPPAQVVGDVQQELQELRTELWQLREARRGARLAYNDNVVPPPEYSLERGE
jgi:hypothetical protein